MDALELLVGRESAMKLSSPGPDQDALDVMFQSALRAPDHGRLRPWRFIVVPEDKRERFGELMADCLGRQQPDAPAPQPAMMTGDWKEAKALLSEAVQLLPEEPMIVSLQGLLYALTGKVEQALECVTEACAIPKSFGHAHHSHYQIACILSVLNRPEKAFEWLERSVDTGFACWPFFLRDPCLKNLRSLAKFEVLVSSLQAKYPDHWGLS